MLTHAMKKIIDTMIASKEPTVTEKEGVYIKLIFIQEEYLENAPGVNRAYMGVINHVDTWHIDPMRILLQHLKPKVMRKGKSLAKSKRDVMIN